MAATINRVTDSMMQERTQAPLDKMKDWVTNLAREVGTPLASAVQGRMGIAHAGKRMLDEGGEAAELGILAKKVALDAVALDNDVIVKLQNLVDLYSEASSLLQEQTSGLGMLGRLVGAYAERSKLYSKILETVGEAPQEPPMTDVELDAVKFVQLRQAKAGLGLRDAVGGARAGRHGSSFFNCVERDRRPQGSITSGEFSQAGAQVRADSAPSRSFPEDIDPMHSLTPSVIDWTVSAGANQLAGDNSNVYSCASSKPSVGGSMASKVEASMKMDQFVNQECVVSMKMDQFVSQECVPTQSFQLPRGDTLDTLNTCLDSLDTLKTVIENSGRLEEGEIPSQATSSHQEPTSLVAMPSSASSPSRKPDDRSVSPRSGLPKDAERQAASRRMLQETQRSTTPPRSNTPTRTSPNSSINSVSSTPAETALQREAPSALLPGASFQGPYPGMNASTVSYAVGTAGMTASMTAAGAAPVYDSMLTNLGPAAACHHIVGDAVEIYSKSSSAWVAGSVVRVDGWMLTVQYGDRERKIDLKEKRASEFFRLPVKRTPTSAPVFDSMLTNQCIVEGDEGLMSTEPSFTKTAIL